MLAHLWLRVEQVFALKLPTAQRMYRYLDKHFYYSPTLESDLREFACGHVGLAAGYDTGELKRRLQPAIRELEAIGFIEPASPRERYVKIKAGVWRIRFQQGTPKKREKTAEPAGASEQHVISLAEELTARGVRPERAGRLVREFSPARIRGKLVVFDWLVRRSDVRISRIPAGYLVKSIVDDYDTPPRYVRDLPSRTSPSDRQQRSDRPSLTDPIERKRREQEQALDAWLAARDQDELVRIEEQALAERNNLLVKHTDVAMIRRAATCCGGLSSASTRPGCGTNPRTRI